MKLPVESINPGINDVTAPFLKVRAANPDAMLLVTYARPAALLIKARVVASSAPTRRALSGSTLIGLVAAVIVAVALPVFTWGYVVYIANLLLVFVMLCLGPHIVIGKTGQFSMAHAGFYGIGIYASALANRAVDLPYRVAMLFGALVAGAVGLFIGALALRMRDIYLALATFAFGEANEQAATEAVCEIATLGARAIVASFDVRSPSATETAIEAIERDLARSTG